MLNYYGEASGLCRDGHTSVGGCFIEKTLDQGYGRVIIKGQTRPFEGYIDTYTFLDKKEMYMFYTDKYGD